jgi:hypothetical protein
MPEQIRQAKEHNGDIVLPTADYITYLAGSKIGNELLNDIRVRPDAMSMNEAKTYHDSLEKVVSAMAKEAPEVSPEDKVFQDVLKQAKGAGLGASESRQYAALYASRYGARAQRLGIDPFEAYQRSGIEIRKGEYVTEGKSFAQTELPKGEKIFGSDVEGQAIALTRAEGGWRITHLLDGQPVKHSDFANEKAAASEFQRRVGDEQRRKLWYGEKPQLAYFQEGKRGSITFANDKAIIDLFKGRDLSTVLHETGHLWLAGIESRREVT